MFEESRVFQEATAPSLATMTGESYQPARIYYQVGQKNAVLGRFKRLRCIDCDREENRWSWLYKEEAQNIEFTQSYRDIPKQHRPLVLGYFTWKGDKELQLDVCSFERVIAAIDFFDHKINRRLAKVTKIKVVNKLFSDTLTTEELSRHHAVFFEEREAVKSKEEMDKTLEEIASQYESKEEQREATFAYFEKIKKKTLPEVEELETHFYEDGLESIVFPLRMRNIEATEHWRGNKNFSQFDLIETLLENLDEEEF
jgi:hypothetical protein